MITHWNSTFHLTFPSWSIMPCPTYMDELLVRNQGHDDSLQSNWDFLINVWKIEAFLLTVDLHLSLCKPVLALARWPYMILPFVALIWTAPWLIDHIPSEKERKLEEFIKESKDKKGCHTRFNEFDIIYLWSA